MSQVGISNRVCGGRRTPLLELLKSDTMELDLPEQVQSFPAPLVELDTMRFLTVSQIRSMKEERKNYARLQKNLETLPVAALILDSQGCIEFANNGFTSLLGYQAKDILGKSIDLIVSEKQLVQVSLSQASQNPRSIFHASAAGQSGSILRVEISESEMEFSGNYKVIAVFHELTSAEEQAKTHNFLAMVTHELKTPLSCVNGILSLIEEGVLGELTDQGRVMTQQVRQTCRRLVRLVNDLLDLERIQAGKLSLDFQSLRLSAVCKQAIESVQPIAADRKLSTSVARELRFWGDEDRILQVLINLLSNAIKFSPDGTAIEIVAEEDPSGQNLKISVLDEGRGIPEDKIETVFQCFEQVDILDAKIKGGTGLGLAICKAIVQEHGGEIGVSRNTKKGCAIWFTLPRLKRD